LSVPAGFTLCYHAIAHKWPAALAVTPEAFRLQMRYLQKRGHASRRFSDMVRERSPRTVAITFDDAFASVFEFAFPIMRELGLIGTVFVVTRFPDTEERLRWPGIDHWLGGEYDSELRPMSWDQLRELQDAGWEVGSHTHTHPWLTSIDDMALRDELERSREVCSERMGTRCTTLAYPYGDHDGRVAEAARRAGYEAACTLDSRDRTVDPLRVPRAGIYHVDSPLRFRAKVSPIVRRMRARDELHD
jgi:peptidoglycan/xylan/chitin deacetylase (PgdA/CDA1 family)